MDKLFKFFGVLIIVAVVIFVGIPFVQGFIGGVQQGLDSMSDSGSSSVSSSVSQISGTVQSSSPGANGPVSSEELKQLASTELQSGFVRAAVRRFTLYSAKYGTDLIIDPERETLNTYITNLMNDSDACAEKTYFLFVDKELFGGDYFITSKDGGSMAHYLGEVDSEGKPHGYGLIHYYIVINSNNPDDGILDMIDYIGNFDHGRKSGYGIQFHCPDDFYGCKSVSGDIQIMLEKQGMDTSDPQYKEKHLEMVKTIMQSYFNVPIYEGEFKDNQIHGKGNYSNPYSGMTLLDLEDSLSSDRILDYQMCMANYKREDILLEADGLYVGEFRNGKPYNAKRYMENEIIHDGRWKDFAEPA